MFSLLYLVLLLTCIAPLNKTLLPPTKPECICRVGQPTERFSSILIFPWLPALPCSVAKLMPICSHVALRLYVGLQLRGLVKIAPPHKVKKPRLPHQGWHWNIRTARDCRHPDPMQSSRDIARIAPDRMGWPTLPPLGGGILLVGHRGVAQTILQGVCMHFSCFPGPACAGEASRHFCTFADDILNNRCCRRLPSPTSSPRE